jgi:hypothetical protein
VIVSGILLVAFGLFLISGARSAAESRRADYKRNRRLRRKERSALQRFVLWEPRTTVRADTIRTKLLGGVIAALGVGLIVGPEVIG